MFRQRYPTSMPLMSGQCDSDSDSDSFSTLFNHGGPTSTQGCSSLEPWVQYNKKYLKKLICK